MKTIDINQIVKAKTGKRLPKPLLRIIEWAINLKGINRLITQYGDKYKGIDFAKEVLNDLSVTSTISGLSNIPTNQPLLFVSNHPLGALEALAIGKELQATLNNNICFIANELLSYIAPLKDIFIPVTVGGNRQSRSNIYKLDKVFASQKHIIMFPSGTIARRTDGIVQDSQWKKMFVTKARLYGRTIVPIHCSGSSSDFFLSLSNFRKKIGIKSNLELILIPREVFKYRGKHINITVGEPISPTTLSSDKTDMLHAQDIRKIVCSLNQ